MLYIYHCGDFCEIISLVIYEGLRDNGIECQLSRDVDGHRDDVWVLFCSFFDIIKWPSRYIVYQTEPLLKNYDPNGLYMKFLRQASQVWEYSKANLPIYESVNKNVIYLPFRYSKCLETWNDGKKRQSDQVFPLVDVSFLGHSNDYRRSIISQLKNDGINVVNAKETYGEIFGSQREEHLKNSKISLILHKCEEHQAFPQDISRIFTFGAKRYFMISETTEDCAVKSLIQCPLNELSAKIQQYLKDDRRRQRNVDRVYNEIISMRMADEFAKNMNFIKVLL